MSDSVVSSNVPEYPGVWKALGSGWDAARDNLLVFLLAILILVVVGIPVESSQANNSTLLSLLAFAYWLLLYPLFDFGTDLIFLRGVRGEEVEIRDIIEGFRRYFDVVLASLLVMGLVGISLVVFIIPGIYVASRLVFVPYLVMDEELEPIAAVETSWQMTKGHVWTIIGLAAMSFLICLLGLCLLIVGIIPALMWVKASFAALYLCVAYEEDDEREEDEDSRDVQAQ